MVENINNFKALDLGTIEETTERKIRHNVTKKELEERIIKLDKDKLKLIAMIEAHNRR